MMKSKFKHLAIAAVTFVLCFFSAASVHAAPALNKTTAALWAGTTTTLTITGSDEEVKWDSSEKSVATVSQEGKVTAKKAGTAIITAVIGEEQITCKVTVKKPSIKLNKSKATIYTTGTKTANLTASVKGPKSKVTWRSSDKTIAVVNSKGKVTAKKAGTAVITAKANGVTAKCKVTVKKKGNSTASNKLVPLNKIDRYQYFRRYMTDQQLKKAYNAAVKIVKPLKKLSKKEQLTGVAVALREMFDNDMSYSMSSAHYDDPYGYLILKKASCAGCARTTGFCLNILGIKYEHVQENQYAHQWARVKVGKKYWICDPYGLYCGPEPAVRKHPYLR